MQELIAQRQADLQSQIAKRQAADNISAKRQIWIDELRKEVAELRAQYENPRPRKTKENSRQYKIQIDGRIAGFIKEWDSGKVALEINLAEPSARESLVQELKARFHLHEGK